MSGSDYRSLEPPSDLRRTNELLVERIRQLEQRDRDLTLLGEISDLLQTCSTFDEAYRVIVQGMRQLFPSESGALCVINDSQNLVEVVVDWGGAAMAGGVFGTDDCWALRSGRPHFVSNLQDGVVCQHSGAVDQGGCLCVPMIAQGKATGVLHVQFGADIVGDEREVEARRQLALLAGGHFALTLANLSLRETLRHQALRDPLTGLFNRRYLEETLERELRRATRRQRPIGVIMLDLDHFKDFNDTVGHVAADAVLREVGTYLQSHVRGEDIACRYGGEEFILILVETRLADTARRAEQLRDGLRGIRVTHGECLLGPITMSCGVAAFPEHGPTRDGLIRAADAALYRAKGAGRDRVVVADGIALPGDV